MKICPKCQTQYDEDIIRFCTRDGSPLVEENPSFTAMPSQSSIDDIGEETLITRNRPVIPPPAPIIDEEPAPRVVIPIGEEKKQSVKPLENPPHQQQQPRRSNTALVVLLTIFGTVAILAIGVGGWWLLSGSNSATANKNSNSNSNVAANNSNTEVNYNSTFSNSDLNTNINANSNVNSNANLKSPSPTKTPTPKPSPTVDANANTNANIDINSNTVINISPANSNTSTNVKTVTPTPTVTPKPSPANTTPSNVNIGVMNSRARELRKPAYPDIARQMGASGQVVVQISIDENGNVTSAKAVSGHLLLRVPAEAAARQSSFNPVKVGDRNVRATGIVVYNFINQ